MTSSKLLFRCLTIFLLILVTQNAFSQYSSSKLRQFVRDFTRLENEGKLDSINLLTLRFSEFETLTLAEKAVFCLYKSIYYKRVGRFEEAIAISKEGLKYFANHPSQITKKRLLINLADIYFTMLNFEKANQYAIQAKKIKKEGYYDIDNYCITGSWYERNGQYRESISEYEKALQLIRRFGDRCKSTQVITKIAYVYGKTGDFDKGIRLVNKAIKLADSCQELVSSINVRKSKYGMLKEFKRYKEANEVYDTIILLEGKYALNERNEKLDALEAKYKNQLKTQINTSLKLINQRNKEVIVRQQVFLFCLLAGLLVFGLMVYILRKFYLKQKEANLVLAEQQEQIAENNKQLQRLNVLNQRIFSVISHDFKGPINTLRIILDNEEIEKIENPQIAAYIKEIGFQLAQSDAMLESLLDWAKTELSISSADHDSFELHLLVSEVLQQLDASAREKQIDFKVELDPVTQIFFRREVLKIVLRNLISNAIKFSFPKGIVEITYDNHCIKIKDYGKGIPPGKLDKLFRQRISPGLGTLQESGFGLGLYLSYELIQKYGGQLSAENNEDAGCTFIIFLPQEKPL